MGDASGAPGLWNADTFKVTALVRAARGTLTQSEFGKKVGGISQSAVSKYEKGTADPPAHVIETCVRMVLRRSANQSSEQVAHKVKVSLADPRFSEIAAAIGVIVDAVAPAKVGRPSQSGH